MDKIDSLHTDFYQINMGYAFFKDGIHEKEAVFDLYFREIPFKHGYAVFAGLQRVIEYLNDFKFSDEDIEYLMQFEYDQDYLVYLKQLRFTGNLVSVVEGEIVFANEPLISIKAPLIQAQLIETALLNIVNYQTLIASKASRLRNLASDKLMFEFGARRAQEIDAALWGTRAAYLAGFDGTSLVSAGKKFGIPIVGTHSHSFVQAYQDELTAFRKYAQTHHDCTFLVDTYNTLKQGVPNAIKVAKELNDKSRFKAIRIDSGDLTYHSNEARKMLDEAGFEDTKIIVSNDLDEDTIASLLLEQAKIDAFGIGTKLITSFSQPALGAVYKLCAIEGENKKLIDVIKLSGNVSKVTYPGEKQLYRLISKKTKKAEVDYITLKSEVIDSNYPLKTYNTEYLDSFKEISDYYVEKLLVPIYEEGRLVYQIPTLNESREYHQKALSLFWSEHKRYRFPARYFVNYSQKYMKNRLDLIKKYQE